MLVTGFKLLTSVLCVPCSASTVVSRAQNSMRKGSAVEAAAAATTLGECMNYAAVQEHIHSSMSWRC
jgi:hypothetical protein